MVYHTSAESGEGNLAGPQFTTGEERKNLILVYSCLNSDYADMALERKNFSAESSMMLASPFCF
jgi:hypothetical protein